MCRNIRVLHNFAPPTTAAEVEAAALQYVRKVSGATRPSATTQAAFDQAVAEIAATTQRLLAELPRVSRGGPARGKWPGRVSAGPAGRPPDAWSRGSFFSSWRWP